MPASSTRGSGHAPGRHKHPLFDVTDIDGYQRFLLLLNDTVFSLGYECGV
ncbi:hypothetical protein ABIC75_000340 [Dyella japonica]|uniref:Uncharacterized protein n=1 Tax=Dyella japonica TaxID=231455 RepID=A0ABV2JP70_9GAMM